MTGVQTCALPISDTDLHLLEMAILQYIFLDCDESYKQDENNEDYLNAKKLYEQKEFKTVLLNEEKIPKVI